MLTRDLFAVANLLGTGVWKSQFPEFIALLNRKYQYKKLVSLKLGVRGINQT